MEITVHRPSPETTGARRSVRRVNQLMPPRRGDRLRSVGLIVALLAVFAGVSVVVDQLDDDPVTVVNASESGDAAGEAPSGPIEGEFLISGASTVFPIVLEQAEVFGAANEGVAISVEGPGSGDGAQKFCDGEVPIANASRLYKDEELAACEANGIDYIELRRAIDGITVITSTENDLIDCVSFNDLYALVSEEASDFALWSDANALTSLWGGTTFPEVPLEVYGPGEESGTFDSFGEIVMESVAKGKTGLDVESREFVETIRPDYTSSPNDNVILQGIEASDYSIGWVGFAFAKEAEEAGSAKLLQVSVEDGGACVSPTEETIASADFPIARFLYTYVNAEAAANDPAVIAFVDYMMSEEGLEAVPNAGYIGLAEADQLRAQSLWANRVTGPAWE